MGYPIIDVEATGANILRLRKLSGLSVKDLQEYFGFEGPQAIYKWQWGKCLPSVDNLFALSRLFNISIEEILVEKQTTKISFFSILLMNIRV
ncbi:helix-turn-helix domain-containing protein [Clostridium cuniculi]|uniref:helix-turn-helix domain-containing protein n=1 Tax=Clostridium cuniculi TaxID=2548455 RepID=UPI001054FFB2|nr:helix-turn-helix transcriptional regulator [Clostridium cuniculi]